MVVVAMIANAFCVVGTWFFDTTCVWFDQTTWNAGTEVVLSHIVLLQPAFFASLGAMQVLGYWIL